MTPTEWSWLLAIVGTLASIAGLVFSWMAWIQAKGAKRAAEEASEAVRLKETSDEFLKLAADAKDLMTAVQSKERDRAILAANNLAHLLAIAGQHRVSYLPEDFSTEFCVGNLRKVSTSLASEGFPETPQKMAKLLARCNQIHDSLCGISGSVKRRTEGADNELFNRN